jgi:hypothetical protein
MKALDRRTVLKGLLRGSVVSLALPPLEAMMNDTGTAWAGGAAFPKRFGVYFWGNGVLPDRWVPTGEGTMWAPSPILMPLTALREHITVVSGMRVATLNTSPHGSGPAGLFSGDNMRAGSFTRPSIDQLIAQGVGSATRLRSIETGVERSDGSYSYAGPGQRNPTESNPRALFNRLFGEGFRAPGDMGPSDPRIGLRRSVLDVVGAQGTRLRDRLGAEDRRRLEQHLDAVRTIERQLQRLEENPPNLAACRRPEAPPEVIPDTAGGRPDMRTRARIMAQLVAMALACDITRVFFHTYTQPVSNTLFGNAPAGHHQLTHDEPGDQPQVFGVLRTVMEDLAVFLDTLRGIPEGDQTLLDHTLMLCTSDCSFGRTHALDEYPIVLAGGRSAGLRRGVHLRARGENTSKLCYSLLQMMGVRASEFGVGPGRVTDALSGLTV